MTKTVCDICRKEIPTTKFVDTIKDLKFCVSSYGRILDICTECRESLNMWIITRRAESEGEE